MLKLKTLGEASLCTVDADGRAVLLLAPGKALALVAHLASQPGQTANREQLIDLLWANLEPSVARHALRQMVWYLRQRLGDTVLLAKKDDLVLNAPVQMDRDEFLAAVDSSNLDEAVRLYEGDYLSGFAGPGQARFEEWADLECSRLRLIFVRAAELLIRRWLSDGRYRDAQAMARRLRDIDPQHETAWRLLLEALLSANDIVMAGAEADAFEAFLRAEDRESEPATGALVSGVGGRGENGGGGGGEGEGNHEASADRHVVVTELIGRDKQFSKIINAWESVQRGASCHVHLMGGAGLGKTRLLSDVHVRLRALGATVVTVRANPGERQLAYAFAGDIVKTISTLPGAAGVSAGVAASLIALNPSVSSLFAGTADSSSGPEAIRRRTIALTELLATISYEKPVALLLDDLHWSDAESRQMLVGAVAKQPLSCLIVTTTRPMSEGNIETPDTVTLALEPLDVGQVGVLVNSLGMIPAGESWADSFVESLHAATGGSPLLVIETLQLALEQGSLVLEEGLWSCPVPQALQDELDAGGALRNRVAQATRDQRWILLLLSVAGAPMDIEELRHTIPRSEKILPHDLSALEQRGLINRIGDAWQPGHDEIATLAMEEASPESLSAAHAVLGRALVEEAEGYPRVLPRAARHLAAAGAEGELARVFDRWVRYERRRGDRRGLLELASETLGEVDQSERTQRLVRSLPLRTRLGLTSPKRAAAAATVAIVVSGITTWAFVRPDPPPPDAELLVVGRTAADSTVVHTIPIRSDDWDTREPLRLDEQGKVIDVLRLGGQVSDVVPRPDGRAWVVVDVAPDSGGMDLFVVDEGGAMRRLTFAPGDDFRPSWSPDGAYIVFSTGRWNARSRYDLAVIDAVSGEVRPLITSDAEYHTPRWSPDGTRIAYLAGEFGSAFNAVCWITVNGDAQRCYSYRNGSARHFLGGWYDRARVLVGVDSIDAMALALLDIESEQFTIVESPYIGHFVDLVATADACWIAYRVWPSGLDDRQWMIFPFDRPELTREVVLGDAARWNLPVLWNGRVSTPTYINRVEIRELRGNVPLNATYRLQIVGVSAAGDTTSIPIVTWTAADSTVAVIDDQGVLHPRQIGSTVVFASAGGWRWDSVSVTVAPPVAETVFEEDWTDESIPAWRSFGVPEPAVVIGPDSVPAFWNRGDSSFTSGAYSVREFDAASGYGVDVMFSAPINQDRWQSLELWLTPQISEVAEQWDHRTGSPPGLSYFESCSASVSDGGSLRIGVSWLVDVMSLKMGQSPLWTQLSGGVRSGAWHRFRLQLFPDGTCGVAVDGQPILHSQERIPIDRPFGVMLIGRSHGNVMLHGPLEVWEGVRGDIDWRVLSDTLSAARGNSQ